MTRAPRANNDAPITRPSHRSVLFSPSHRAPASMTALTALSLAVSYWYGRRVHASVDYVVTFVGGSTENVTARLATSGKSEQELLLLVAMGL